MKNFIHLITRVDGILNSRPITPASSDPHYLNALTPGHFLIGQPIHAIPEPDSSVIQINRLNRWQLISGNATNPTGRGGHVSICPHATAYKADRSGLNQLRI
ncbi:Integrase catalytic domain-containing protein [Aphis craccivora]|uniref:Integrase catalytic domain-containing protein n=1 Tax=Aphis craccivora TaxID=307492 RepID=A0A6G0YPY8_APHCR|nr:Integrase catalytic domain-containing protein [Aphis craccivora]